MIFEQKQIVETSASSFEQTLNKHFRAGWRIIPNTTQIASSSSTVDGGFGQRINRREVFTATIEK